MIYISTIKELIAEIRPQLNDIDSATFQPEELLKYFNQSIRSLRRIVAIQKPTMVSVTLNGVTTIDDPIINLSKTGKIIKLLDIRISNKPVFLIDVKQVDDFSEKGKSDTYYRQGSDCLRLNPIPDKVYPYTIIYVPEGKRLALDDDTGFPSDFDDLITEMVGIRAGLRNSMSIGDEKQLLSLWDSQVKELLKDSDVLPDLFIKGYFS